MQNFHLLHKSPQAAIAALNPTVPIQSNRTHHDGWVEGKAHPAILKFGTSQSFMRTAGSFRKTQYAHVMLEMMCQTAFVQELLSPRTLIQSLV
jgi:hypothetical protein